MPIKFRCWDASLALWILAKVTTWFIDPSYFLNVIGSGNDLSIYSRNFCLAENQPAPANLNFLYFPAEFFEFGFNPRANKKTKTLVFGNAGDEKNLHPGGRKFVFFNQFSGDILFPSLVSFAFFVFLYFCACLFVFWN